MRARSQLAALLAAVVGALFMAPAALAELYAGEVARDAPRGYWRLGEPAGTVAADARGSASGTYMGGVRLGAEGALPGDLDTAAHFDGSDDRLTMGDPASGALDLGSSDLTVDLWLRTSVNREEALISKGASGRHWLVTVTDDPGRAGQIRAKLGDGAVTRQAYGPPLRVDDGRWHHVAVVYDRDTGIVVYVDGVAQATPGPMAGDVSNAAELLVGKVSGYAYFSGDLDEVALYPAALSAERVAAHVEAARGGLPTDTTPPETSLSGFAFTSEVGATFDCRLDGGAWTACVSPYDPAPLPDGSHELEVRAVDAAGNADPTPAAHSWTIDTTPPQTSLNGFAFTSEAGAVFECRLDGGAWAACVSPYDPPALPDGSHELEVRAVDAVGNADLTPASHSWTIDTTPPQTSLNGFAFTSEAGAVFDCRLDGGAWAACVSPFDPPTLPDGSHELEVRAVDAVGNVDPTPATHSWTIDTTPPDTAIDAAHPALTRSTAASIVFSSEPGAAFECRLDGDGWAACASPLELSELADGEHELAVRAVDATGNADPSPASTTWRIDTVAPDTAIEYGPDGLSGSESAVVGFSSEPGAGFECRLDAGEWLACESPVGYPALIDGDHVVSVRAVDAAGNVDATPAARAWSVDTTAPETSLTSGPEGTTAMADAAFTFATDELWGATFDCRLDGGAWEACAWPHAYASLGEGGHEFEVRARDAAGNVDPTPASRAWIVDTEPPATSIEDGPPALSGSADATVAFSSEAGAAFECRLDGGGWSACDSPHSLTGLDDGDHVFAVRAADGAGNVDLTPAEHSWTIDTTPPDTSLSGFSFSSEEGATSECRLDGGGAWAACVSPYEPPALPDGTHQLEVRAVDAAGNADPTPATHAWTIDTAPPDTALTGERPPFGFSSEPGATFECRLDAGEWASCSPPKDYGGLDDGEHQFAVRAVDDAGNADPTPASQAWTQVTDPPETEITSAPTGLSGPSVSFAFASPDTTDFECRLDAAAWEPCTSPMTYPALPDGARVFEVRATTAGGKIDPTPAVHAWTVDAVAPDTRVTGGPPGWTSSTSASISFTSAEKGVAFECRLDGAAWEPCTSPKTLTALPDGAHLLEVRAKDTRGNADPTPAIRTWNVDTVPPDTDIDEGPTGLVTTRSATVHFANNQTGSKYDCRLDGAAWTVCPSRVTYSNLADGPHTVQARAKDPAGNVDPTPAERSWEVDATPAETNLLDGPEGTTAERAATFTFASPDPRDTLQCRLDGSSWAPCTSPKAYGPLIDGEHSFDVRAIDGAGNPDPTPATRSWTTDALPPAATESHLPARLPESAGTTFHVATTGSNTNPGTADQPWRTVQKAVDTLAPGQTALVHAGTYTQRVDVNHLCAATAPCTIEAAPNEPRPILRMPTDHVLRIRDTAGYWRFSGFTFRDSDITSGGLVDIQGHHIEISDSELTNAGDQDVYLEESSHHVHILDNHLHHSGLGREHQSHGAYVQGDDHVLSGNLIHDHPFGFGIQVYDRGDRAVIVNNTITHNAWSGVVVGGSGGVSGVVARNNVIAYNEHYGIAWDGNCPDDSKGTTIAEHNVLFANGRGAVAEDDCLATSLGTGNRLDDPLFADAAARDLHLLPGSPAIGYALPLWAPGRSPDAGALPAG